MILSLKEIILFFKSIGSSKTLEEQTELKEKIAKACVYIHLSLVKASVKFLNEHKRYYYLTPSCFIDLLKTFIKIFDSKRLEYLARKRIFNFKITSVQFYNFIMIFLLLYN